jgi:ferrous iron transport protein A
VTVVRAVAGDDALARRLAAAGLWPGVRVEQIGRAPFGDPLLFRVHGYRLALRRSEAARVQVELVGTVETVPAIDTVEAAEARR